MGKIDPAADGAAGHARQGHPLPQAAGAVDHARRRRWARPTRRASWPSCADVRSRWACASTWTAPASPTPSRRSAARPAEATWKAGVDVLCFGGTKNGMAMGEAVVFFDRDAVRRVRLPLQAGRPARQQDAVHGGAVGRRCSRRGAWRRHAAHANAMAKRLEPACAASTASASCSPSRPTPSSPRCPRAVQEGLRDRGWDFYTFVGDTGVRLMCSWDTSEEDVDAFVNDVRRRMTNARSREGRSDRRNPNDGMSLEVATAAMRLSPSSLEVASSFVLRHWWAFGIRSPLVRPRIRPVVVADVLQRGLLPLVVGDAVALVAQASSSAARVADRGGRVDVVHHVLPQPVGHRRPTPPSASSSCGSSTVFLNGSSVSALILACVSAAPGR